MQIVYIIHSAAASAEQNNFDRIVSNAKKINDEHRSIVCEQLRSNGRK